MDIDQLLEARAAGADAVLLIVAALSQEELVRLHDRATALGLAALVEVHDEHELSRAIDGGARIVGVNNRDSREFLRHRRLPAERRHRATGRRLACLSTAFGWKVRWRVACADIALMLDAMVALSCA